MASSLPPKFVPTSLAQAATEARALAGGTTSRPPTNPNGMRKVALVVDDDAVSRAEMVKALSLRFDVIEAKDGLEAVERAGQLPFPPAVIITDVQMPRLDGFSMVKLMKGHPLLRQVPVVFYSSRAAASDVVTGLTLGVKQYLPKSIGPVAAAERILKLVA